MRREILIPLIFITGFDLFLMTFSLAIQNSPLIIPDLMRNLIGDVIMILRCLSLMTQDALNSWVNLLHVDDDDDHEGQVFWDNFILLSNAMPTVIFFRDQCCIFWAALFPCLISLPGWFVFFYRKNTSKRNDKQRREKSKLPVCITRVEFISEDFWLQLILL